MEFLDYLLVLDVAKNFDNPPARYEGISSSPKKIVCMYTLHKSYT